METVEGPTGQRAGNLPVTDVRRRTVSEETELFSVVAETAALSENGVSIYSGGKLAFPSFKNEIRIPEELGQLLTMAHAERRRAEPEFPLLDARLLYRADSFVSERLLFTGRCALGTWPLRSTGYQSAAESRQSGLVPRTSGQGPRLSCHLRSPPKL
ncbi:hypothetical protein CSUI_005902 [Cystoisospora suis]|uniref:Uncharacterized protein n=1 Tax=Cystoisospora suis TaxID=483139 RepID=A0A2C6KS77_9APIC|nr:hypothetical protein CSUI_005902 [Cystoisospora suis]